LPPTSRKANSATYSPKKNRRDDGGARLSLDAPSIARWSPIASTAGHHSDEELIVIQNEKAPPVTTRRGQGDESNLASNHATGSPDDAIEAAMRTLRHECVRGRNGGRHAHVGDCRNGSRPPSSMRACTRRSVARVAGTLDEVKHRAFTSPKGCRNSILARRTARGGPQRRPNRRKAHDPRLMRHFATATMPARVRMGSTPPLHQERTSARRSCLHRP
jgi:hypothetical protein